MYTLVTDMQEKETLLKTFSSSINRTCLEHFTEKNGYGNDFIAILFKDNLDEYEDQEELNEIGSNRVILLAEPPAAPIEEKMYLTYEELYSYVKGIVQKNFKNDSEIQALLSKLKKKLNLEENHGFKK